MQSINLAVFESTEIRRNRRSIYQKKKRVTSTQINELKYNTSLPSSIQIFSSVSMGIGKIGFATLSLSLTHTQTHIHTHRDGERHTHKDR